MPRRWTLEHYVALLNLAIALAVLVGAVVLGASAPTPGDAAVPLLLGLCAVAVLVRWGVRSWRDAERKAAPPPGPQPSGPPPSGPSPSGPSPSGPPPSGPPPRYEPPPLSPDGERELARVVRVLGDAGVFAPRVPEPQDLRGPVADQGEPVTAYAVLSALHEAHYYVEGFDAAAYSERLAFHDHHVEQLAEFVREQVDDLVRLAGGGLDGVGAEVELVERTDTARVPTTLRLHLGDRTEVLEYVGAAKYLSTVPHVALARILRERATGLRLAWVWSDQGPWVTALPDGGVERLNAALGPAADDGFEWVDEQEPIASGETYPR